MNYFSVRYPNVVHINTFFARCSQRVHMNTFFADSLWTLTLRFLRDKMYKKYIDKFKVRGD